MHLHEKLLSQLKGKLQRQRDVVLVTEGHIQLLENIKEGQQVELESEVRRGTKK